MSGIHPSLAPIYIQLIRQLPYRVWCKGHAGEPLILKGAKHSLNTGMEGLIDCFSISGIHSSTKL
jgi:hypothetical protein